MIETEQKIVEANAQLARRVEEASLNSWPALHQTVFDGWMLRFAKGFTKRANSVVPIYPSSLPLPDKVRYCENLYARERLKTIFRLTDLQQNDALDGYLAERGYEHLDPTKVMIRPITNEYANPAGSYQASYLGLDDWLTCYRSLTGMPEDASALHRMLLNAITHECAFAVLSDTSGPVACGLAVLEHELVGLFDIYAHPEHRGRGLGRALVGDLLHWGANGGARFAYLQVIANNAPARALYQGLGFSDLYNYWYRAST